MKSAVPLQFTKQVLLGPNDFKAAVFVSLNILSTRFTF